MPGRRLENVPRLRVFAHAELRSPLLTICRPRLSVQSKPNATTLAISKTLWTCDRDGTDKSVDTGTWKSQQGNGCNMVGYRAALYLWRTENITLLAVRIGTRLLQCSICREKRGGWQGLIPPLNEDGDPVVAENFGMGVGFDPFRPVPATTHH